MNERIQVLGVAAGLLVEEWDGFNRRQLNPAEQKFAELIIRDCIDTVDMVYDEKTGMGHKLGARSEPYRDIVDAIEDRFGVDG